MFNKLLPGRQADAHRQACAGEKNDAPFPDGSDQLAGDALSQTRIHSNNHSRYDLIALFDAASLQHVGVKRFSAEHVAPNPNTLELGCDYRDEHLPRLKQTTPLRRPRVLPRQP
jgi:hypothetical protein